MYVTRITRHGLVVKANLFEKHWSEEMLSNNVVLINKKSFLFRSSAYRWAYKEISKNLFENKKLEVVDG
jgi:hypothetical protein